MTAVKYLAALRTERRESPTMPYRHDVDGLRAVAVLLVVLYHVWFGRVSGGVDVFLMISAFFLTQSFFGRIERDRPLSIGTFLAGRFRRLMPAAAVTIAGTLVAAWFILPQARWPQLWREGWASVAYMQNWVLAAENVDYYARDAAVPSPLQHFWSLAVQGQVFLLWPVLILVGAYVARRTRLSARLVLGILFGAVFLVSLVFSVYETADMQSFAYFDTRARLWEFAAGSLLAIGLARIRVAPAARAVLGWAGLAAVVFCGVIIDVRGGFPGYLALWPVVATALVVISGHGDAARWALTGILGSRPLRFLGRDAYALYLVHWPILVLWLTARGQVQAGPAGGVAIILSSFVAAWLLSRGVDRSLRLPSGTRGVPLRNLGVMAACVLLVGAVLVPWQISVRVQADEAARLDIDRARMVLAGEAAPEGMPLIPQPIDYDNEWERLDKPCAGEFVPTHPVLQESFCLQTDNASADRDRLIVIVGDSHAQQLGAALAPVAKQRDWGVVDLLRGGCSLEAHPAGSELDAACGTWQQAAMAYILDLKPAAVYTVVTAAAVDAPDERLIAGAQETVDRFNAAGIPVIGVRDNPRSTTDWYSCALERKNCAHPASAALAPSNPGDALSGDIALVDFTPWICPRGECRAEIGGVALYLDGNHLSRSFVALLAPMLKNQITDLVERIDAGTQREPSL